MTLSLLLALTLQAATVLSAVPMPPSEPDAGAILAPESSMSTSKPKSKEAFPSRLLPLREAEMFSGPETGCQFAFSQGNDSFIFIIGHRLTIRTDAGVQNCKITDAQFGGLGSDTTTMSCGKRTLSIRPTGPSKSYPEADSTVGPAALTMNEAGRTRTVNGRWSIAC